MNDPAELKIKHTTRYQYDQPVYYALQELRLTPKDRPGQKVLDWRIEIEGGRKELSFEDQHHNQVQLVSLDKGTEFIEVRVEGRVETSKTSGVMGRHGGFAPLWYFKRQTPLTTPGAQLRLLAGKYRASSEGDIARLHALSKNIADEVTYQTGVTQVDTVAEDALIHGAGVCQDHAHIFLSAARHLGFPARYVSGYLLMNDRVDQDATHAWAEVHIDGLGWVGFDISNQISPDQRYVPIATGLDYLETAPISGMRFGAGSETMHVALQVQQQ